MTTTRGTLRRRADPLPTHRFDSCCPSHPRSRCGAALPAPSVTHRSLPEGATHQLITLETEDGVTLEARWDRPAEGGTKIVFCHPHPQQGGTMRAPLMAKVTAALVADSFEVLRFNFRGIGKSTGTWDAGRGELGDVSAAVEAATAEGLIGWSFGAAMAMIWQAATGSDLPLVGIAPPVHSPLTPSLPSPDELMSARRSFVLGDRDQFTTVGELSDYAESIGASLTVLAGSDHFFYFREQKVAEAVAEGLR